MNDTYKVVGGNCLADFINTTGAKDIAALFECVASAMDAASEFESEGGSGGPTRFGLDHFLGFVAAEIRVNGWLSRTNARAMDRAGAASADAAWMTMVEVAKGGRDIKPDLKPTETDWARGGAAVAFMETFIGGQAEVNDYLYNLDVVMKVGTLNWKMAGLAASLIPTAEREQGKAVERRQFANLKKTSKHFGTPGEKVCVKAVVTGTQGLTSDFGVTTLIRFVTTDGNAMTWFASGSKADEWDVEGEIWVTGTVKKHDTYQGLRQTVLTRVNRVSQEWVDAETAKAARKAAKAAKKAVICG